jgi:hypothetical protein
MSERKRAANSVRTRTLFVTASPWVSSITSLIVRLISRCSFRVRPVRPRLWRTARRPVPRQAFMKVRCGMIDDRRGVRGRLRTKRVRIDVVELGGLDQGVDGGGAPATVVRPREGRAVASRRCRAAPALRRWWSGRCGRGLGKRMEAGQRFGM